MENEDLQRNENQSPDGESLSEGVEVRVDPPGLSARPLSQFILAKQFEEIDIGSQPVRPVTLVSSVRPLEVRRPAPSKTACAPIPIRRIEYPFYDSDSDLDFPIPDPPAAEPQAVLPQDAPTVQADLADDLARSSMTPSVPVSPAPSASLSVRYSAVSAEEAAVPLLLESGRSEPFPIFDLFLAAESAASVRS